MLNRGTLLFLSLSLSILSGCTAPATTQPPGSQGIASVLPVPLIAMPTFDGVISSQEWASAARVNGTFTIHDGGKADGTYPFSLWLGATNDGLVLGMEVDNGTPNPYNTADATEADHVYVFFSTNGSGNLTRPSFALSAATYSGSVFTGRHFWNGRDWEGDPDDDGLTVKDGQPSNGTWAMAHAGNGTTSLEIFTPRHPTHAIRNGLHLAPGAEIRIAVAYMRQGDGTPATNSPDAASTLWWPHDVFPGDGYNPRDIYNPQGWLALRMT